MVVGERNTEPERSKTNEAAATRFLAELLRHFHQDQPDVAEDPQEAGG